MIFRRSRAFGKQRTGKTMTQAKACLAEFKVASLPVHRQLQDFDQATLPMQLLDVLPAAIYVTDAEGRIIYFNDAAAALWGCRPKLHSDQWCGSWRLFQPDGEPMPHDQCPMAIALKERRSIRGDEAIAERPDGTRVPFMAFPTPLYDASGALVGAVNMLIDMGSTSAPNALHAAWRQSSSRATMRSSARTSTASSLPGTRQRSGCSAIWRKRSSANRSRS